MERYSLIVVADETAPIRRYDILKSVVHRAIWGAGLVVVLLAAGLIDYVSVRSDVPEFEALKVESAQQRERIQGFETTLAELNQKLDSVREFERKVRIIANLPGSAGTGGGGIVEVIPGTGGGGDMEAEGGVDAENGPDSGAEAPDAPPAAGEPHAGLSPSDPPHPVSALSEEALRLGAIAEGRGHSLNELVEALESKHRRLASSPAIWPTKGWLTSRYGYRTSPFTARKQFHGGLDIAGAQGSPIIAPARGKVTYSGKRGPLGLTVILDHGYGVRTFYGHTEKLMVKKGDEVERGQKIATLGSTGRSTGPHLHYVVEVDGKARNPLDYIFD
jgi:hypothetical protein